VATVALRILGRREEADDLVQDVFLRAHRGISRLREPTALRAWLTTVTVRLARRRLRGRRFKLLLGIDQSYDYSAIADASVGPEDIAILADVYRALDRLPVAERLAWSLRHLDGERLERVAELCGCSLATVKRRISSAHARLLEETGGG
jgi:RNA polymerase sigma-70 factor (ECF subfamily)